MVSKQISQAEAGKGKEMDIEKMQQAHMQK